MSSTEISPSNEDKTDKSRPRLSITQVVASALAAITATFAASYFGVSGTVIGAALASVVTVVGNAVYSHSIQRTGARVRGVVPISIAQPPGEVAPKPDTMARPPRAVAWQHAALAALGLFLVVAGIVTGIELAAGRPLSNIVHDRSGHGTSLFGGGGGATEPPAPPTRHPASTASGTATTPATTSRPTAPSTSSSASPSPSPTPAPTDSSTATTTPSPTPGPTTSSPGTASGSPTSPGPSP